MTCELCTKKHPNEIWRNDFVYVIDAKEALLPGYIRVILTRHVAEMSDLTEKDRVMLMDIVNTVEREMRAVMAPKKINLAQFGTMVPHVHWHIIARYEDDAFYPASTWSSPVRTTAPDTLAHRRWLADRFNEHLVKVLQENY